MHKLLAQQLRGLTDAQGGIDLSRLVAVVERSYAEFDRERRLNDRAAKLMEEELQAANARVRQLGEQKLAETLESVPCAIALLDTGRRIHSMNSTMASLCPGLSILRRGDKLRDILAAISPAAELNENLEKLEAGETCEVPVGDRWYLLAMHRLSDGGYAMAFSDITPLKEREAALGMARDAAESANRLKSKFLATMSHELRTPLNAILGFSEVIRDHVLGETAESWRRYRDYAGSVYQSGSHLLALISEVLDLSKLESGSYQLHFECFDLGALIRDALLLVTPQAQRGGVTLKLAQSESEMRVEADLRAIKQVLINLLSNAVKFTPSGGEVEVSVHPGANGFRIRVRDTGIGIAPEHLKSVFEPFHQGDAKVSRRYEGTGLGLSVCRGLLELHGGAIGLESEPGIGTTAYFDLPSGRAPAAAA